MKKLFSVIFLSITYGIAAFLKQRIDREDDKRHATLIKQLNNFYFATTISLSVVLFFYMKAVVANFPSSFAAIIPLILTMYYCFSRFNEVFMAFVKDSFDKLVDEKSNGLMYYERIQLALKSYIELIFDYGIFYYLLVFLGSKLLNLGDLYSQQFNNVFDAIYFSGVTIVTLGYGDYYPTHLLTKFFSVYEVLNGMLLIVVTFTIYLSLHFESDKLK